MKLFKLGYTSTYFVQGILLGLFLSYYAFFMSDQEYILLASLFLLTWSIKPIYSILIDKFNWLASIFAFALAAFFMVVPSENLPLWVAVLGGFALGLMDVSADGWLTTLTGNGVNPDFWTGIGFATRTTGFLLTVVLTMMTPTYLSVDTMFTILRVIVVTASLVSAVSFTKLRFKEEGSLGEVWRHFKKNAKFYVIVFIVTSWGSGVFDISTKIWEARIVLIEIILLTLVFTFISQFLGREWYIKKFIPVSAIVFTVLGFIGSMFGVPFLLELTVSYVASLPWPIYGIVNDKAGEISSYPVFYTSLLYGLSNVFDIFYINTLTPITPIPLFPLVFMLLNFLLIKGLEATPFEHHH